MEGSESEAVFDSLGLNPQQFIDQAITTVDELVEEAFDFFQEQASSYLKLEGTERAQDLSKGVNIIRNMVQSDLDKRLSTWEQFCLEHCFQVPEGFTVPKNVLSDELPVDSNLCQNAICDPDLDAQLALIRNKLTEAGKESAALNRELQSLDRQSASNAGSSALVNDTLQLYELNSYHEMFQEMEKAASELRAKIGKVKNNRIEETKRQKADKVYNPHFSASTMDNGKGFSGANLEDLQQFLAKMKSL